MVASVLFFFFSSRRRHTRLVSDWSSDVCSSDLIALDVDIALEVAGDAYAAAAFDLAFDCEIGRDQGFLAGQAGVGAHHWIESGSRSGNGGGGLGLRRSVEPDRFPRFEGRLRSRPGGHIVFPESHDGSLFRGGTFQASAKRRLRQSILCRRSAEFSYSVRQQQQTDCACIPVSENANSRRAEDSR